MRYLAAFIAVLMTVGLASAETQRVSGPCTAVEGLSLPAQDRLGKPLTTPPFVGLESIDGLSRLARRSRPFQQEVALSDFQSACLEALTGARLKALKAGAIYAYRLQTPTRTVLVFHVGDLEGGEALISARGQQLLTKAERLMSEGRQADAAQAYMETIQAGARPFEVASAYAALGKIEKDAGLIENALGHYNLALETYPYLASARPVKAVLEKEVARLVAARRLERLGTLTAQAADLAGKGRYGEAIPLAREALALTEEAYGPDHVETAGSLETLASLYEESALDAEAEPLYGRALAIRQAVLGAEHPKTAETRSRIAELTRRIKEREAAAAAPVAQKTLLPVEEPTVEPEGESAAWLEPETYGVPSIELDWGGFFGVGRAEIGKASGEAGTPVELKPASAELAPMATLPVVDLELLGPPGPDSDQEAKQPVQDGPRVEVTFK